MIQPGTVIRIGDEHFRIRYRDRGFPHKEDRGLWRCDLVRWDGDHWGFHDDDDWMISNEGTVVAREVGWDLKRFKPGDWGYDRYMKW